ncbi:MAG: class I SAM-dependent methyltransferase [Halofilum sp. (in: g-proteobacteria)]|nr:class I SAM-dependent methyltransferase [Halofilum sp. (in: g-proteobacteria)]
MIELYPHGLVFVCADPARRGQAAALADTLALPIADVEPAAHEGLVLRLTTGHLELQSAARNAPGPVRAEFAGGRTGWRGRHGSARDEALARAAGVRRDDPPRVIDATAGLGRDAFVLAALGCTVTLIERHPVVAALLRDGLERASADPATRDIIGRMHLVEADAREFLRQGRADVVVVDPMHPPRRKDAAVKKEMQVFRELVGTDEDAGALLEAAIPAARRRVVVKRPRGVEPVAGPAPSGAVEGRSTRFDIYAGGAG